MSSPHKSKHREYSKKESNCVVDWIRSPLTNRWIEIDGQEWKKLYPKYRTELEEAKRGHTRGKIGEDGVCRPKQFDPPLNGPSEPSHRRNHSPRKEEAEEETYKISHRGGHPRYSEKDKNGFYSYNYPSPYYYNS